MRFKSLLYGLISIVFIIPIITFAVNNNTKLHHHTDKTVQVKLVQGDLISINLPGEEQLENKELQINNSGQISLPEVGNIAVAGLTLSQARKKVIHALSKYYRDLSRLQLTIAKKQILVKVTGYVKKPGEFVLANGANLQMAFVAAGGLLPGAQMDKVQLIRGKNKYILNYKRYLDTGDAAILKPLKSLDTIFVPVSKLVGNIKVPHNNFGLTKEGDAGNLAESVKVFGEVHHPGAYSFKNTDSPLDYLLRAGGVTRYAGVDQIRVIVNNKPYLFNLKRYLDTGNKAILPRVERGTTIFVPQQIDEVKSGQRTVYVMGQVQKPGAYELNQKTNFLKVLANAGGPNRYADTRKIRLIAPDGRVKKFDLQAYTEGIGDTKLPIIQGGDAIFVAMVTDVNEKSWLNVAPDAAIKIMGAVTRPGRYEWSDEMSFLDILSHAGGPDQEANISKIRIIPPKKTGKKPIFFDLEKYLSQGGSTNLLPHLRAGYTIFVPELPKSPHDNKSLWSRQSPDSSIYVFGAVHKPGRYHFDPKLGLLDILSAADGPTNEAEIQDITIVDKNGPKPFVEKVNLARFFATGDMALMPKVLPGDVIYVPNQKRSMTETNVSHYVKVIGAVHNPGRYRFNSNFTVLDLIAEAGGPTDQAYTKRIVVINMGLSSARSHLFNLRRFVKTGDVALLPTVRSGDIIYVPTNNAASLKQISEIISTLVNSLAIVRLVSNNN